MSGPITNTGNTPVTNIILPSSSGANFATHDSQYGLGGWSEISFAANLSSGFTLGTSDAADNTAFAKLRQGKIFYAQDTQGLFITESVVANGGLGNYTATFQAVQVVYQFTSLASLITALTATPPLPTGIHQVTVSGTNGYTLFVNYNGTSTTLAALEGVGTFNSSGGFTTALNGGAGNVPNGTYRVGATTQNVVSNVATQLGTGGSGLANVSIAGTTGLTAANITTGGPLTLTGTLLPANGGTGVATLTGIVKGNGTSAMSAAATSDITSLILNRQLVTPTTGQTITLATVGFVNVAGVTNRYIIGNTTNIAALTIVLPTSPVDGVIIEFAFLGGVSTLTITGGTLGALVSGGSALPNQGGKWDFSSALTTTLGVNTYVNLVN